MISEKLCTKLKLYIVMYIGLPVLTIITDQPTFSSMQSKWQKQTRDVVGEKCIRNYHGDLAFGDCVKEAWKNDYSRLLNKDFEWDKDGLLFADPI